MLQLVWSPTVLFLNDEIDVTNFARVFCSTPCRLKWYLNGYCTAIQCMLKCYMGEMYITNFLVSIGLEAV